MLVQLEAGNRRVTGLSLDTDETFDTPFTRRDNPHRAYITIIEGCDKSCAYCVVPFTRGPERSRTSESVMAEARRLAAAGYTEIQLLGQNVNSYRDPSPAGWDFATLLARVAEIPGIRRVRYTTSHPRDFGKAIVDAMDANPVLCDHVHLPVQSGSSRVLAAMDRLYTRDEYMRRIEWLKTARRRYSITTDIIVGFPGETERGFRGRRSTCWTKWSTIRCSASSIRRGPTPPPWPWKTTFPRRRSSGGSMILQEKQRAIQIRRNAGLDRQRAARCWWRAATRRWASGSGARRTTARSTSRTRENGDASLVGPVSARARHALRAQLVGGRERNCGVIELGEGVMEVEMKIRGLMMDPVTNMPIVILKDVSGNSVLPIWVGVYEANAIALEIEKVSTPRPMTHDLIKSLLLGLNTGAAQGGGERAEGRHVLRRDLAGPRRRADQRGFAPQRCPGAGAAPGLPDLRGRDRAQILQAGRHRFPTRSTTKNCAAGSRASTTRTSAAIRCDARNRRAPGRLRNPVGRRIPGVQHVYARLSAWRWSQEPAADRRRYGQRDRQFGNDDGKRPGVSGVARRPSRISPPRAAKRRPAPRRWTRFRSFLWI